jgi:CheY-like chemotaxis protein
MEDNAIHILLIDDVKFDIKEIKHQLGDTMTVPFVITHLVDFKDSLDLLKRNDPKVDVVLLDLGLICPHSPKGIFKRIETVVNDIPIIVITGANDHELALFVMNSGA